MTTASLPITQSSFAPPQKHTPPEAQQHASAGEWLFDASVYGGLGYIANGAISVALICHAARNPHGRIGKPFNALYENMESLGHRIGGAKVGEQFRHYTEVSLLGTGGWVMMFPMKWLEDYKPNIIKATDNVLGTKPSEESAKNAYDKRYSEQPPQTYVSMLGGRTVSFLTGCTAGGLFLDIFKDQKMWVEDVVAKHFPASRSAKHNYGKYGTLAHLGASEVILAGIGTVVLYGSSKSIAWVQHRLEKTDDLEKEVQTQAANDERAPLDTNAAPASTVREAAHVGTHHDTPDIQRSMSA